MKTLHGQFLKSIFQIMKCLSANMDTSSAATVYLSCPMKIPWHLLEVICHLRTEVLHWLTVIRVHTTACLHLTAAFLQRLVERSHLLEVFLLCHLKVGISLAVIVIQLILLSLQYFLEVHYHTELVEESAKTLTDVLQVPLQIAATPPYCPISILSW